MSTIEEYRTNYEKLMNEPFPSEEMARLSTLLAQYLPTEPTRRECNAPHEARDGHMIDLCRFKFAEGEYYAEGWNYGDHDNVMHCAEVLLILGRQAYDRDGLIDPGGHQKDGWVVARVIASNAPGQTGKLRHFAPSSCTAHRLVKVDVRQVLEAALAERCAQALS